MSLEIFAMNFLRFTKNCPVALFERSPRYGIGEPDVLGITKARYLLEIEIKRSLSDFKANAKKHHMVAREKPELVLQAQVMAPRWPKQFWFLVPDNLAAKIEPLVPDYAGLMRGPGLDDIQQVKVIKPAPTNKASLRLSPREMMELGHTMANQILSQAHTIDTLTHRVDYEWDYEWYPKI